MATPKKEAPAKPPPPPADSIRLLKFTADWCGPCRAMKPVLKKFLAAHPELTLEEIDVDGASQARRVSRYVIQSVPTFVFETGAAVRLARLSGTVPLDGLEALYEGAKAKLKLHQAAAGKKLPKARKKVMGR